MGLESIRGESRTLFKLVVCQSSGFGANIQRFFGYLHQALQLLDLVIYGFDLYGYLIFDSSGIYASLAAPSPAFALRTACCAVRIAGLCSRAMRMHSSRVGIGSATAEVSGSSCSRELKGNPSKLALSYLAGARPDIVSENGQLAKNNIDVRLYNLKGPMGLWGGPTTCKLGGRTVSCSR
jgi:hypothetical protein